MYGTFHLLTQAQAAELVLEAFVGPLFLLVPILIFQRHRNRLRLRWYGLLGIGLLVPLALIALATKVRGISAPYDAIFVPPLTSGLAAQLSLAASSFMVMALIPTLVAPPSEFRRARTQLITAILVGLLGSVLLTPVRVPITQPLSLLLRHFGTPEGPA